MTLVNSKERILSVTLFSKLLARKNSCGKEKSEDVCSKNTITRFTSPQIIKVIYLHYERKTKKKYEEGKKKSL